MILWAPDTLQSTTHLSEQLRFFARQTHTHSWNKQTGPLSPSLSLSLFPLKTTPNWSRRLFQFKEGRGKEKVLKRHAIRRGDPEDLRGPQRERIRREIASFAAVRTRQMYRPSHRFVSVSPAWPLRVQLAPPLLSLFRSRWVSPSRCSRYLSNKKRYTKNYKYTRTYF